MWHTEKDFKSDIKLYIHLNQTKHIHFYVVHNPPKITYKEEKQEQNNNHHEISTLFVRPQYVLIISGK